MLQDLKKIHQLRYRRPISVVKKELKRIGKRRESDIWIWDVIDHWEAFVVVDQRVYIFHAKQSWIYKLEIKPFLGYRENGTIIF